MFPAHRLQYSEHTNLSYLTTSHHAIMKLSTSIVTKAVACLLMLALAVTTQVVNGEKIIIVNCRVIIHLCYDYVSIASFLFDTHPNIILHASCLLPFKPSQLRTQIQNVVILALVHGIPAAVQPMSLWASAVRIKPLLTNARKIWYTVMLSVVLLLLVLLLRLILLRVRKLLSIVE